MESGKICFETEMEAIKYYSMCNNNGAGRPDITVTRPHTYIDPKTNKLCWCVSYRTWSLD